MYLKRFGMREEPFKLTPDPRFFYRGEQHERALAELLYGVEQRKGFMILTGEIGTGKTTVCRALLDSLSPEYETALVLNPRLTADELIRAVVQDFGVPGLPAGASKGELIARLNLFLLKAAIEGRGAVLLVDESQQLSGDLLEELRLLSNLETDREKLLQIVLIGQPELVETLSSRDLRQLRQRIAVWAHLGPLDQEETSSYVSRRLTVASGGNHVVHFTPKARKALSRLSGGYPRTINLIADRALLGAFSKNTARVNSGMVVKAGREVAGGKAAAVLRGRQTAAAVVVAAAIIMVSIPSGIGNLVPAGRRSDTTAAVTESRRAAGTLPDLLSRYFTLTGSEYLSREARLWHINGRTLQDVVLALRGVEAREQYGMSIARVPLVENIWRISGAVGIVPLEKAGRFGVISPDEKKAGMWRLVVPGVRERSLDGVNGGGPSGMTQALVLYRPAPDLRLSLRRGDRGPGVLALQTVLVSLGVLPRDQAIGTFGPRTERAVSTLQERWGLRITGMMDDATGYYLSRLDGKGRRTQT